MKQCTVYPGCHTMLFWPFPDPALFRGSVEEIMDQFRALRDGIRERVRDFAEQAIGKE